MIIGRIRRLGDPMNAPLPPANKKKQFVAEVMRLTGKSYAETQALFDEWRRDGITWPIGMAKLQQAAVKGERE